ncbi:MAG: hypothetical protein Q8Q17_01540 [bacterium]|nr:hypothetical protein [bacterium]
MATVSTKSANPQSLSLVYEQSTGISPEEAERRLEHAFSVLFEETLKNMSMKMKHEKLGTKIK